MSKSRTRTQPKLKSPTVEVHATNLHNPSHMEFTGDGRLLVSEHTAGRVLDVTEGGDQLESPDVVADGLEGPASIMPTRGDEILVTESTAGRVADISKAGTGAETFAEGLELPYSLGKLEMDGETRLTVTDKKLTPGGSIESFVTDITGGGDDHEVLLDGLPAFSGPSGFNTRRAVQDDDALRAMNACSSWKDYTADGERAFLSVSPLGEILDVSDFEAGSSYNDLIYDEGRVVASGLGHTGGIKFNEEDGLIYGAEPYDGTIFAVDPDSGDSARFDPAVVRRLDKPSCLRFDDDGAMYACGRGDGTILKITDWR